MTRTGLGIDTHAFAAGRPLILGGVDIPHEQGLAGHSDADVLTHAVIDALLQELAVDFREPLRVSRSPATGRSRKPPTSSFSRVTKVGQSSRSSFPAVCSTRLSALIRR
jgi:hypothetical protein